MTDKMTLFLSPLVIALWAIGNLARLFWNISISIGSIVLPGWTGAFAFLFLGLLSAWSFRALYAPAPSSNPSDL